MLVIYFQMFLKEIPSGDFFVYGGWCGCILLDMKNIRVSKGFTLIELLVVIAIIGILSAVVLASLNTARTKGNDAAIKSNLGTIRTQSNFYFDQNVNKYSAVGASIPLAQGGVSAAANCDLTVGSGLGRSTIFADPTISAAIAAADKSAGGTGASLPTKVQCQIVAGSSAAYASVVGANATTWTVWVPTTSGTGWCVDSNGNARSGAAPATIVALTANASCL